MTQDEICAKIKGIFDEAMFRSDTTVEPPSDEANEYTVIVHDWLMTVQSLDDIRAQVEVTAIIASQPYKLKFYVDASKLGAIQSD